jgi:hypothetical protein
MPPPPVISTEAKRSGETRFSTSTLGVPHPSHFCEGWECILFPSQLLPLHVLHIPAAKNLRHLDRRRRFLPPQRREPLLCRNLNLAKLLFLPLPVLYPGCKKATSSRPKAALLPPQRREPLLSLNPQSRPCSRICLFLSPFHPRISEVSPSALSSLLDPLEKAFLSLTCKNTLLKDSG